MGNYDYSYGHDANGIAAAKGNYMFWILQIFNLMNVILGSGILAMPYVMATLGWGLFIIGLLGVCCLGIFAIDSLLRCTQKTGITSYEQLAGEALGPAGRYYTIACIYFHTLIAMCSYMIIVKQELPEVVMAIASMNGSCPTEQVWWINGNVIFVLTLVLFVMPLSTFKRLDFLGWTSGLAMILMGVFSGIIIAYSGNIECPIQLESGNTTEECQIFKDITAENAGKDYAKFEAAVNAAGNSTDETCNLSVVSNLGRLEVVSAMPIVLFAMMCQESIMTLYSELKYQSREVMLRIVYISFGLIFTIYTTVAFFGFKTWRSYTISEVLIMYTINFSHDAWIILARCCSLICVILSAPLLHFPNRRALLILVFGDNHEFSWLKWIGAMIFNLGIVAGLVMGAKSLGQLFTYAGIFTANSLMLILPAWFYYKIETDPAFSTRRKICLGLTVFGFVFMAFSFVLQVYQDFFKED